MKSWPTKKLSEVCEKLKLEKAPVGTTPYIEIGDIDIETKVINFKEKGAVRGSVFAPPHCVIVSRVRPTRGAVALLDKKIAISSAFTVLKPKPILDLKFLFYYLAYNPKFFEYLRSRQKGSNYPSCREKDILNLEIPLPPLDVQKRIVARIEEFFEKIDKAKELREEALEETEGIFRSALKEIFNNGKREKWRSAKLKDLIENIQTGTTPPSKEEKYFNGNIQWFTPEDLGNSKFLENSSRTITEKAIKEGKAKLFKEGTLLFVGIGATLGKVGIANKEVSANQQITGLYFKNLISPEFAYYWFLCNYNYIRSLSPSATLPILNQERLKNLTMIFPPLSEQKKIVAYLNDLREKAGKLKQLQQRQLEELTELKQSILDKAFSGKLI